MPALFQPSNHSRKWKEVLREGVLYELEGEKQMLEKYTFPALWNEIHQCYTLNIQTKQLTTQIFTK